MSQTPQDRLRAFCKLMFNSCEEMADYLGIKYDSLLAYMDQNTELLITDMILLDRLENKGFDLSWYLNGNAAMYIKSNVTASNFNDIDENSFIEPIDFSNMTLLELKEFRMMLHAI